LLHTAEAQASEASGTSEVLLGWSEDGRTYAVEHTGEGQGATALWVYTDGAVVLSLCDPSENEDSDEECVPGKTTKAISTEVQRVDIRKNKHLKKFHLRRVSNKWRKAFNMAFVYKATNPGKSWNGTRCHRGWVMQERATQSEAATHMVKKGCLDFKGAYLSPSGKHLLVKQNHRTSGGGDEEGFWTNDEVSYLLVPLKPAAAKTQAAK
jgi:hypothetical protein